MRVIMGLMSSLVLTLWFLVSETTAQSRMGSMSDCMGMMGWPMMLGMGLFWVLLLILMVLGILWLIKQLRA